MKIFEIMEKYDSSLSFLPLSNGLIYLDDYTIQITKKVKFLKHPPI